MKKTIEHCDYKTETDLICITRIFEGWKKQNRGKANIWFLVYIACKLCNCDIKDIENIMSERK